MFDSNPLKGKINEITSSCCNNDDDLYENDEENLIETSHRDETAPIQTSPVKIFRQMNNFLVPEALTAIKPPVTCEFFDLCEENEECVKTPKKGFSCVCKAGFETGKNGECQDINECNRYSNNCTELHKYCSNTEGSFKCQECMSGFKKISVYNYDDDETDFVCEDVNECKHKICPTHEVCTNLVGSFRCTSFTCPAGYKRYGDS